MRLTREALKDLEKRGLIDQASPPARQKFGNRLTPRTIDGEVVMFHSAGEAWRWDELELMLREGLIRDLRRQVSFPLFVNGVKVARFIADFTYQDGHRSWGLVVEDFKSEPVRRTDYYQLKKRLFEACTGLTLTEVVTCKRKRKRR